MPVDPAAISPGSTEYGDRQELEAGIAGLGGGGSSSGGPPSPTTALPGGANPLTGLLSGSIKSGQGPLTAGLSVGPGSGPIGQQPAGPLDNDLGSRLKLIASQATSPTLRHFAQQRLRRMHREGSVDGQ